MVGLLNGLDVAAIAEVYVPLATAVISLVATIVALLALSYSRRDRAESQRALELDALRRQQDALLSSLQGDKEAVGFMALQLVRDPQLVTDANRTRLFCALCLAFVFESSSRARALILKALQTFAAEEPGAVEIRGILSEMETDFRAYEQEIGKDELTKYFDRIHKLRAALPTGAH